MCHTIVYRANSLELQEDECALSMADLRRNTQALKLQSDERLLGWLRSEWGWRVKGKGCHGQGMCRVSLFQAC